MELFTINLAANQTQQFVKGGVYFEIIDASYPVQIEFAGADGTARDFMRDAVSGLFLETQFNLFSLKNGPLAQSVTVLLHDKGRGGSRRQPGNVRVIDAGAEKTRAGRQFVGVLSNAANAGALSCTGIRANGQVVAIKRVIVSSAAGGTFYLFQGTSGGTAVPASGNFSNKFFGAANSLSQFGVGSAVAVPLSAVEQPGYVIFSIINLPPGGVFEFPLTTPLLIDKTAVFGVTSIVANKDVSLTLDYEEI